jgi:NAD(P)-dependent dehydrogenase (short-subunit alcohol dehydrogenase family)
MILLIKSNYERTRTYTMSTTMQGKICLITGANSGVGKATASELAQMGATVVMVSRNRARGEEAQKEIQAHSGNNDVHLLLADLSSQQSIRQLAEAFQRQFSQLHVLINNAGLFSLGRRETVDGLEMAFAVNYLAPFLLTNLLLDTLKASAPARVINVSSDSHEQGYINMDNLQSKRGYNTYKIYGQSKLALILFSYELARKLEGTGVTVNALHPGFVSTNIGQSDVGPFLRMIASIIFRFGISPEEGAKTSIYLASSPDVENVTGKYFVKSSPKRSVAISYDESLQ